MNTVLAVNPGSFGFNHRDKSTGIEVSPLTMAMIVCGTFLITFRVPESP
jgi:hypothetical protein